MTEQGDFSEVLVELNDMTKQVHPDKTLEPLLHLKTVFCDQEYAKLENSVNEWQKTFTRELIDLRQHVRFEQVRPILVDTELDMEKLP